MNTPYDFITVDYPNSKYIVYSTNNADVGNHSFKLSVNTNNQ